MHYYNLKIKSNDGEYCLNCNDKEITQREMDIYFSFMFGASKEFVDSIKKIERKNIEVKSIDELEPQPKEEKINNSINNYSKQPLKSNDEFTQIVNPAIETTNKQETISNTEINADENKNKTSPLIFKPLPQEELVFQEEDEEPDIELVEEDEEEETTPQNNKAPIPQENIPEIVSIKEEPKQTEQNIPKENTMQQGALSKDSGLQIIGEENEIKEKEEKLKQVKKEELDKTIELVQNAVNNLDIVSDETFDIDIPDTYSTPSKPADIDLKEFDEEFEENNNDDFSNNSIEQNVNKEIQQISDYASDIHNSINVAQAQSNDSDGLVIIEDNEIDNQNTLQPENNTEINSIFSDDSPFENPPESQNIIAAKEYPEAKQALNLDFKTFLSNYETNGIIDEFLICAYYIKHISGQHSFNMKYINSKIFQATGKIADSSVINGLISGDFIKVIEVDGTKKYSISSTGEEYFMTHYQR